MCPFADNALRTDVGMRHACHVCDCRRLRCESKHAGCIGTCRAFTCLYSLATNAVFPVNHCIQSTASTASKRRSKFFLRLHHFLRQPLLLLCHGCSEFLPRLQDLQGAMTSVKTAAIIHASRRNGWLHRNQKKFQCEERQHKSVQAKSHKTSTKFKVLSVLAPSKKRMVTSHHSIPSHLTPSLHQTNLSTGVVQLKVIYSRQSLSMNMIQDVCTGVRGWPVAYGHINI